MEKVFPVDIYAVKEYGIKRWQNEFFWPVSDKEYFALYKDIGQNFKRHVDEQPEELSDLLLIQRSIIVEYRHLLHALKVVDKISKEGYRILYSDKSLWYKEILTDRYVNYDYQKKIAELIENTFIKKAQSEIKKLVKNFVYSPNLFRPFGLKDRMEAKICGSTDLLVRLYIKNLPYRASFTSPGDWIFKDVSSYDIPDRLRSDIKRLSVILVADLAAIGNKYEIELSNCYLNYLRQFTEGELLSAAMMLCCINSRVDRGRNIHLLIQTFGSSFYRTLCVGLRRNGAKVTSFTHGGHVGLYNTPTMAFTEFALSDEFVTFTQASAGLFEKIKDDKPPLKGNKVTIKTCADYRFLNLWQKDKSRPLPKKIKRVMIIGYPYTLWRRPQTTAGFSLMHLDLELQLIEILKRSGYDVFYKTHPDTTKAAEGIFDKEARVISRGNFQDYLGTADAFLFGSINTTAFPLALCTNKPIIAFMMDDQVVEPFPEALGLLKKRCSFITAHFNQRNRIVFDEKELLEALGKRPQPPNDEFMERYYFPKGKENR